MSKQQRGHMEDDSARAEAVSLLKQRAALLQPTSELIARSLRRCERSIRQSDHTAAAVHPPAAENDLIGSLFATKSDSARSQGPVDGPVAGSTSDSADAVRPADGTAPADGSAQPVDDSERRQSISTQSLSVSEFAPVVGDAVAAAGTPSERLIPESLNLGQPIPGSQFRVGQELAGYKIADRLGKGGMGDVFRAVQLSMNREVALKVLAKRLAYNGSFRTRFMREARAAGRLQHPHLIAVHDVGEAEGLLFFSMEMVRGRSVGDILKQQGSYAEVDALRVVRQVLEALRYAHSQGLIHRDIKPDNIMVTDKGSVKVADLGLARETEADSEDGGSSSTQSGTMMGTPSYMAPEQGQDARAADHRADIYSIGATLYHMVFGKVPFEGRTAIEVVVNATTKPLTFPRGTCSAELKQLLRTAMGKSPEQRFTDCEEMLMAVDQLLGHRSSTQILPGALATRSGKRARQLVIGGVCAVLVIGFGLVWRLSGSQMREQLDDLQIGIYAAVDDHNFSSALATLEAFAAEHPGGRQRAAELQEFVTTKWNAWSVQQAESEIQTVQKAIDDGDHALALANLRILRQDQQLQSPDLIQRLRLMQSAVEVLEREKFQELDGAVAAFLDDLDYRSATQRLADFGQPSEIHQAAYWALVDRVSSAWNDQATSELAPYLKQFSSALSDGPLRRIHKGVMYVSSKAGESMSPALRAQFQHYLSLKEPGWRNPREWSIERWFASVGADCFTGTWGHTPVVDKTLVGFHQYGRVLLPSSPGLIGSTCDLVVTTEGPVDWSLILGSAESRIFINIRDQDIRIWQGRSSTLHSFMAQDPSGASLSPQTVAHSGTVMMRLRWNEDHLQVEVDTVGQGAMRVSVVHGIAPALVRWGHDGVVQIRGSVKPAHE